MQTRSVILVAFLLLSLSACQSTSSQDTVKVGVIAPLSGPLASYGIAFRNGIQLANDKFSDSKVKFVFEDSEYSAEKAISAYRKLTEVEDVDMVMDWGAPTSEAIAPLVDDDNVPFIAFSFDTSVTNVSNYTVRAWNQPRDYAATMWSYLRENNKSEIGVLQTQLLYFDKVVEGLQDQARAGERVVVVDTLSMDDRDFKTSIGKLKQEGVDAVGVLLGSGQISQFYKQAKQLNYTTTTFGTDFFESQDEISAANGLMNGAVYPNMAVSQSFRNRYVQEYDTATQITFAGNGYDTAMLLQERINSGSAQKILDTLQSVTSYDGVLGEYSYQERNGDRHLSQPIHVKKVVNGSPTVLSEDEY